MGNFYYNINNKDILIEDSNFLSESISWWTNTLTCGGVERQIISSARYFYEKNNPVNLLCMNIDHKKGNDFFLKSAYKYCRSVKVFNVNEINQSLIAETKKQVLNVVEGCPQGLCDTITYLAIWILHVQPKLLHIWNADNILVILAAIIANVPNIVIAGQSLSPHQRWAYGFESIDESFGFNVLKNVMNLPNVFMTNNSRAGCRDYENWLGLPHGTIIYTPNIFDFDQWSSPVEEKIDSMMEKLGIPKSAKILGGLFRFVPIKDPKLWVETAYESCMTNDNLYAVICGDGIELPDIKKSISKTKLAKRIIFPGIIEDVQSFLSICSVFLQTSYVEGLPNSIIEAQAYGIPVVTTRCGGVEDIVLHGKTGFIIDERNSLILSKYISYVLKHPEFTHDANLIAKNHIINNFSTINSMEPLEKLYNKILHNKVYINSVEKHNGFNKNNIYLKSNNILYNYNSDVPKISVNMIVYNGEAYISESLDSVLQQTFSDFELIIINDGSTDNTVNIIKGKKDSRIKLFSNAKNMGRSFSRNRALKESKCNLIAIADADDWYFPHRLETQYQFMISNRQVTVCGAKMITYDTEKILDVTLDNNTIRTLMLFHNTILNPSVMFNREYIENSQLYNDFFEVSEDYDLWENLSQFKEINFNNINDIFVKYRTNNSKYKFKYVKKHLLYSHLVKMRQVKSLGLYPTKDEEYMHDVVSGLVYKDKIVKISMIKKWIEKLIDANSKAQHYDQDILENYLNKRLIEIIKYYKTHTSPFILE